jgi:hypothetical protein
MATHTALRVQFPAQRLGQAADKFELSALARFLYRTKRLAGGAGGIQTLGILLAKPLIFVHFLSL